jgi:hypothetical protein
MFKKILKTILLFGFINYACLNAGFSYVLSASNIANPISVINMMCGKTDLAINTDMTGKTSIVDNTVTQSAVKRTGNVLFDFISLGNLFVGRNFVPTVPKKSKSLNSSQDSKSYDVNNSCVIHKESVLVQNDNILKNSQLFLELNSYENYFGYVGQGFSLAEKNSKPKGLPYMVNANHLICVNPCKNIFSKIISSSNTDEENSILTVFFG